MHLNDIGKAAYDNAVEKGFYNNPRTVAEALALIHAEVSEALEDYRNGHMDSAIREDGKPQGFPSELADIIIRVCDLAHSLGIDLDMAVAAKMVYNRQRPAMHGGKRL